jgi:tetratricopeptide (TPR) repeat protein
MSTRCRAPICALALAAFLVVLPPAVFGQAAAPAKPAEKKDEKPPAEKKEPAQPPKRADKPAPPPVGKKPQPEPEKKPPAEKPAPKPAEKPAPKPEKPAEPAKPVKDPVRAAKVRSEASALWDQGKWQPAMARYKEAEALGDDSALSLFRMGWISQTQGADPKAAKQYYERALKADPKLVTAAANLAEILRTEKKYPEAVKLLQEALKKQPQHIDALFNLARVYEDMGKTTEAFTQYMRVLKINPLDDEACNNAGLILLRVGNIERAARYFRKAIKFNATYADAYANLGIALYRGGNLEEAAEQLEKAVEHEPQTQPYHRYLADVYERMGRDEDAVTQLLESLVLVPDDHAALTKLGLIYMRRNQLILATETFQQCVKLQPKDAGGWFRLGLALKGRRLYGEAWDAFTKAQKAGWKGGGAAIELEIAQSLNGMGRTADAEKYFAQVLKVRKNDVDVLAAAALNHMRLGKFAEAEAELKQAVAVAPTDASPYLNMGHVLSAKGDHKASISYFEKGRAHDREDPYSGIWLYFARLRGGQFARAQLEIRQCAAAEWKTPWENELADFAAGLKSEEQLFAAARTDDEKCEALFYAAERRALTGDPATARKYYQQCMAMKIFDFYEHGLSYWRLKALESGKAPPN